jgi:hypothetical protein
MNPPNQPTPRTDAELYPMNGVDIVWPEFARTLERELAETERLRFGADADRRQLRCELTAAKEECEELLSVNATGAERLRFVLEENSRLRAEVTGKTSPIKLRLKSSTYASKSARAWLAELDAAVAERDSLRAEVERLTAKIGNQADRIRYLEGATNHATGTPLSKAIARAEKAEAAFADPHTLHAHCLRTLTEGQIAHLFGERMTAIVNRAEKAEAELAEAKVERETIAQSSLRSLEAYMDKLKQFAERAEKAEAECLEQARLLGMSGEREADLLGKLGRLESELAAIKHGHGELGKYEQLRLKNAELHDIINRASTQFFHDGTDGETAAKMLTVLNEAK